MRKTTIIEITCCLLAILFVYASVSKLIDYNTFKLQLNKSPFLTSFSNSIAYTLPIVEIIIALLLAIPVMRLIGLYASLFLLTLFTAYLIAMLNFSYYIPCSCGGVLSSLSWQQHIIFNIVFIILSLMGIFIQAHSQRAVHLKSNIV